MDLDPKRINEIDHTALDLLQDTYATKDLSPPVLAERLAARSGLEIIYGTFEAPEIVAMYQRARKKLFVLSTYSKFKRNIVIARELGHFILHPDQEDDVVEDEQVINIFAQELEEDIEATQFAASVLMPKFLVLRFWQEFKSSKQIANFFQVTNALAYYRLTNLNLIEE